MYVHTYVRIHLNMCIHTYMHMYVCTFVHTYPYAYVRYMLQETRIFPQACRAWYPRIAERQVVDFHERPAERSVYTCGLTTWYPRRDNVRTYGAVFRHDRAENGSEQVYLNRFIAVCATVRSRKPKSSTDSVPAQPFFYFAEE